MKFLKNRNLIKEQSEILKMYKILGCHTSTNSSIEKLFSLRGLIQDAKRSTLRIELVNKLM